MLVRETKWMLVRETVDVSAGRQSGCWCRETK